MKSAIFLLALSFVLLHGMLAQPYTKERHTRHRFAQLTLGADVVFFPSSGSTQYLSGTGQLISTRIPALAVPRIWVGGLHFWGHAEFGVAFPLGGIHAGKDPNLSTTFDPGVETIAKWYPWAVRSGKLRPYVGFSAQPIRYRQTVNGSSPQQGPNAWRMNVPFLAGLTYLKGAQLLEIGLIGLHGQRNLAYPVGLSRVEGSRLPALGLLASYRIYLDTTVGEEKNWVSGKTEETTRQLGKRLNGWYLGIGPSTAWHVGPQGAIAGLPAFKVPLVEGVFADLTVGYHWHKPGIHVGGLFRYIRHQTEAYGLSMDQRRLSTGLEATKLLGDYHGFVPFIGPILSVERLQANLGQEQTELLNEDQTSLRWGIAAGWDIRPTELHWFYLRTNVRWFPGLGMESSSGEQLRFQQLEVNFIQFVWMLGRRRL